MGSLIGMDQHIFALVNQKWANTVFDRFFPMITDLHKNPVFMACLGLYLLAWVLRQRMYAAKFIVVLILSVGASDLIAYRVVKQMAQRQRPMEAGLSVQLRTHNHSGSSFPSNHAANVFAAATVLSSAFVWMGPLYFLVAALVAYSRVYVGVHFPLDVVAGAIIGILIATIFKMLLADWVNKSAPWMRYAAKEPGPRRW
jgi:undecaprenyl-diphosphatase